MSEVTHQVGDVFGINRNLPLNYQERELADQTLVDSLTRDQHIVIYGSSKQGKTSLRKHCLDDNDYITVHCSNNWQLVDLHSAILKTVGYEVTLSNSHSSSGGQKIWAKIKAEFLGTGAEVGAETELSSQDETTTTPLELEPENVNDIIAALQRASFDKFIVLEDFHYLPIETQRDFAVALKAFHENSSLCFIIIGVWLEENRLSVYNGDLTGRIFSIDADEWSTEELGDIISAGEQLLNLSFDERFRNALLNKCFNSVHIVQEACHQCCQQEGVVSTLSQHRIVGEGVDGENTIKSVVNQNTGRFNSFIIQFADGFQATDLEMHRWLLYPIFTSSVTELEQGIRQNEIRQILQDKHPRGEALNPGNVTQALLSTAALQIRKNIKPTVLDYDQTNLRLNVVDRSFLIWLENQNRQELLELAGLPST